MTEESIQEFTNKIRKFATDNSSENLLIFVKLIYLSVAYGMVMIDDV